MEEEGPGESLGSTYLTCFLGQPCWEQLSSAMCSCHGDALIQANGTKWAWCYPLRLWTKISTLSPACFSWIFWSQRHKKKPINSSYWKCPGNLAWWHLLLIPGGRGKRIQSKIQNSRTGLLPWETLNRTKQNTDTKRVKKATAALLTISLTFPPSSGGNTVLCTSIQ